MAKKRSKWYEVYPQGTQSGNEEAKVFRALGRHPRYTFRSVASLAKAADLSEERVEEILAKYHKRDMVIQNPSNDTQWAYWERVAQDKPELLDEDLQSIAKTDQDRRIDGLSSDKLQSAVGNTPVCNWSCTFEFSEDYCAEIELDDLVLRDVQLEVPFEITQINFQFPQMQTQESVRIIREFLDRSIIEPNM